jgi:hypothetical protein
MKKLRMVILSKPAPKEDTGAYLFGSNLVAEGEKERKLGGFRV